MKAEPTKVIAKYEVDAKGKKSVSLFFPEKKASPCTIAYWSETDGYKEAGMGYFWTLRNPEDAAANDAVDYFARTSSSSCTRVKRDSQTMRLGRWN